MSEEQVEFEPTSLDVAMGGEVDDAPEVKEPEAVEVKEEPEVVAEEPNPEPEKEPVKAEESQADNFANMREIVKSQKAEIEALKQTEPEKAPDVFEDQEAYTAHLEQKFDNKLLDMSEAMVREQFDDYDEMKDLIFKEAETNPAIRANIAGKQNVALAVYQEGKALLKRQEYSDPDYEVKVEARIRAKIEAETSGKVTKELEAKTALKDSLPDDLTSEGSTGNRPKDKGFVATNLDSLFP